MDKYGSCRHTKEDAKEVAEALMKDGTVVFPYSYDQLGCMIVLLSANFTKLGVMPFGGNPNGRIYCGIFGRGCGHLSSEKGPHQSYTDEKLNLRGQDGEHFAEFYSWIIDEMKRPS